VRGQKLPIFSGAGLPGLELAARVVADARTTHGEPFAVIFVAIGLTQRETQHFLQRFESSEALARSVFYLNRTGDPTIERLLAPRPIAGGTMLGIALLGLLANLAVLRVLDAGHDTNLNVAAARLHVLGDLLGSIGASIAAVVILTTGWSPIDPILSLLVAVLIVRSAWALLAKSTRILMLRADEAR